MIINSYEFGELCLFVCMGLGKSLRYDIHGEKRR